VRTNAERRAPGRARLASGLDEVDTHVRHETENGDRRERRVRPGGRDGRRASSRRLSRSTRITSASGPALLERGVARTSEDDLTPEASGVLSIFERKQESSTTARTMGFERAQGHASGYYRRGGTWRMVLETRAVAPLLQERLVLACPDTREAVVIDPGDEVTSCGAGRDPGPPRDAHPPDTRARRPRHGGGPRESRASVPVWLHRDDLPLYERAPQQAAYFGLAGRHPAPIDFFYQPGIALKVGQHQIQGASHARALPGGVCLELQRSGETVPWLFVGDTLFAGSIGRTILPGGDYTTLIRSIRDVLFPFGDAARVFRVTVRRRRSARNGVRTVPAVERPGAFGGHEPLESGVQAAGNFLVAVVTLLVARLAPGALLVVLGCGW